MSVTATATSTRFHVGLHVSNLERSVAFYRVLFHTEPARRLDDYARFELERPALVVALYPSPQSPGGALNHVGLRLPDSASLVEVQRRLEEAGIATLRQEGVECCYARQTKFWVTDPDRTMWEIYTLHEDIEHSGFDDPPLPQQVAVAEAVWEHRLTEPLPEQLPQADDSLDEIRLEGTFNQPIASARLLQLLVECHRVLKKNGRIAVHGLVGDRPFPGTPALPGLASLVQHIPVATEPLQALERAGFVGLFYEKLGDIHCFRLNGVELREMRLLGWKGAGAAEQTPAQVLYKGPFEQVTDEAGTVFRRGEKVSVSRECWQTLRRGPAAEQFVFWKL